MWRDMSNGVTEQGKAGRHRLDDARVLINSARWRGAMYLAGYAVECLLKTKLMRMYDCRHLQELENELQQRGVLGAHATVFTHHLEVLLRLTAGTDRLRKDQALWRLFTLVNQWVPAWRYSANVSDADDATDFMAAVEAVSRWIENNI